MISIVLPKGSLEEQTLKLFENADLEVRRKSDRDYNPTISDSRISKVKILRPQEIPRYVEEGYFDLGISGLDWIRETDAKVIELADLVYNTQRKGNVKIVLAIQSNSDIKNPYELKPNSRISTEYPNMTKKYFEKLGIPVRIFTSYGATEAKVPDIMDGIVDLTETGNSLEQAGLKTIEVLLESSARLIANKKSYADENKKEMIDEIKNLLLGALKARDKALIKLNVSETKLNDVLRLLPSMKAPTISKLYKTKYYAVETVVDKNSINEILPKLKTAGAEDILQLTIKKVIE